MWLLSCSFSRAAEAVTLFRSLFEFAWVGFEQVEAKKLKYGNCVMVNGQPTRLTGLRWIFERVDVVKITFDPDLPVDVFNKPSECIARKGHKKTYHPPGHRGGRNRRGRQGKSAEDAQSIPNTQGYLTD